MEGYIEITEDYWLSNLNYKDIILDGSDIDTKVLEDVMVKLCVNHTNRLSRIWDGKFYIENCDIQEVESRDDFEFMLDDGYVVKKIFLKDNKLWIEHKGDIMEEKEKKEFNQEECDWRYKISCTADTYCSDDCDMVCPYKSEK